MAETRVFGIRHHGPGSARSLLAALDQFSPDALLVEGPPEAEEAIRSALNPGLIPPIALLVYLVDDPTQAVFYPMAEFSPEWNAARYALANNITFRYIDIPTLPVLEEEGETEHESRQNPFRLIAQAAGEQDEERWWEQMVERRQDATGVFEAILELMTALREDSSEQLDSREAQREAHMRLVIRKAQNDGFERIAVVCGAWHAPALVKKTPVGEDQALLKGLPKQKLAATWVPWTYERLNFFSGYGAGIRSAGYYEHLWRSRPEEVTSGWLLKAARALREEDLDASPASVIEAVRLTEALAAVRGQSSPSLAELSDAVLSVLCGGNTTPMKLIERKLIVGERLGEIPEDTPTVPLLGDLAAQQKRLRLKPEASERVLDLDQRNETDLGRSYLLHRLVLLDVHWGRQERALGKSGTFHELWRIRWEPALSVDLVLASRWGNSVESAASAKAIEIAETSESLAELTSLADRVLLANLPNAIEPVMRRVSDAAAVASDVGQMLDALPSLGSILRYGNVRRTDTEMVRAVFESVFSRACIGLPGACSSLDDDAASAMAGRMGGTTSAVTLLENSADLESWISCLHQVLRIHQLHGLVDGFASRTLLSLGGLEREDVSKRLQQAASPGASPQHTSAWLEGFLGESGAILIHDDDLWALLDEWVAALTPMAFEETLPLLRRTFATFPRPERRQLGEKAQGGHRINPAQDLEIDAERAARVLPLLRLILGEEVEI